MSADADDFTLDPTTLAIQEQFLEEWRTGQHPRLSVYVHRYPAYADALVALVASLPPEGASDGAEQSSARMETTPESFPERLWTGDGVGRALSDIFGEQRAPASAHWLPRVAEERQAYETRRVDDAPTCADGEPADD